MHTDEMFALTNLRYLPVKAKQVVLRHHVVLHRLAQRGLLFRHSVPVLVRCSTDLSRNCLLT
jgi:hypothetical protein